MISARGSRLLRACSLPGAASFLFRALGFLRAALGFLRAALFLRAFSFLSAALFHTGSRRCGSRCGFLSIGHAAAEGRGEQSKSKFFHFSRSFYGLEFMLSSELRGSLHYYITHYFTMQ